MAFLASVLMIGILNMTSFYVNFPLLEALAESFNYQINTFFLPTGETTPSLEENVRVSGLSLTGIAYQPSTTSDDHSIMGVRLLGAAYASHGYNIIPTVLAGVYRGLHNQVTRGDLFIDGIFCHENSLEKARTEPGVSGLSNIGGVAQICVYEHISIVHPPRSTSTVSASLGLAYVSDTTRACDVNYYRRALDKLSSFDWVIRGLDNVPLFLLAMGHSCLILARQFLTEGYFPQRVLHQFRHIQNYTSPREAIDRRPIFPIQRHSFTLLVKEVLSWKGKKSSSSEGLVNQDKPTTTSNYDSWWECAYPLPLCPRSLRLRGKPSAPAQDSMPSREDDASFSNKLIKSNVVVSNMSLEEAEVELA
ncbi:hypothetical protein AMTRI_Chr05g72000 [Amborella trichopoda]